MAERAEAVPRASAKQRRPDLLETWPRADKGGLSLSGKTLEHRPQAKLPELAQYLRAKALGTLITTFGPRMAARVSPITRRLHFGSRCAAPEPAA